MAVLHEVPPPLCNPPPPTQETVTWSKKHRKRRSLGSTGIPPVGGRPSLGDRPPSPPPPPRRPSHTRGGDCKGVIAPKVPPTPLPSSP